VSKGVNQANRKKNKDHGWTQSNEQSTWRYSGTKGRIIKEATRLVPSRLQGVKRKSTGSKQEQVLALKLSVWQTSTKNSHTSNAKGGGIWGK